MDSRISTNFKKVFPIIGLVFIFATLNLSRLNEAHLLMIIHGLIYVILGIKLRQAYRSNFAWISFAAFLAIIDESYQKILGYRYFDIKDVIANIAGALVGGFLLAY